MLKLHQQKRLLYLHSIGHSEKEKLQKTQDIIKTKH